MIAKYYYKFYLIKSLPLLPYFTYVNILDMCLNMLTKSQYAHQKIAPTFRSLVYYYNERGSTHISLMLSYSTHIEGVYYDILLYISSGLLPYEVCSEERPWVDEAE